MHLRPDRHRSHRANWQAEGYVSRGADPAGTDTYGTPAWDVACSSSVVGFKTAADRTQDTATTMGYVKLQQSPCRTIFRFHLAPELPFPGPSPALSATAGFEPSKDGMIYWSP